MWWLITPKDMLVAQKTAKIIEAVVCASRPQILSPNLGFCVNPADWLSQPMNTLERLLGTDESFWSVDTKSCR